MARRSIVVLLVLCATAAGTWARQGQGAGDKDVKTIDVTASRFKFEPATITVDEGASVRLRVRSADGVHGLAIKGFRVKALLPKTGETVTLDFVADHAGTFDITCSEYCGSGHGGMKGKLVVVASGQ